jgi:hypothetical protein
MHLGAFISPTVQFIVSSIGRNSSERYLFLTAAAILLTAAVIAHFNRARITIGANEVSAAKYQSIKAGVDDNE